MYKLILRQTSNAKNDLLSGLTVALALVPEAVAFAFVAKVDPLVGLYAAFFVGLITAVLGGRPGMISGATGAMAVVMTALVVDYGVEYLFATVILAGLIQITFGLLRFGKFVRLIPSPVMFGFVNGLAIVIFKAQFGQFQNSDGSWFGSSELLVMGGLIALVMAIMNFLPKLTKAIPAGLVGIVLATVIAKVLDLDTKTVAEVAGGVEKIGGGLPTFSIPGIDFTFETFKIIIPTAGILASIGLIESLMTLTLIDEITETRGRSNRESIAQGLSNVVSGFFSSMGGCAMIGQSMININSGGRGRLSGASAAIFLLLFILFGSEIIGMIPIAALIGVMFMVVIGTFEWATFRIMKKIPKADALVIVTVTVVTVLTDLAIAVGVGIVMSALVFAWEAAKKVKAKTQINEDGSKLYDLHGAIFFGSVTSFKAIFEPRKDPKEVYIDFLDARVHDHSGIEAISWLAEQYRKNGKVLHLKHLSEDCRKLLKNAKDMIEVNVVEDPKYHVADDELA